MRWTGGYEVAMLATESCEVGDAIMGRSGGHDFNFRLSES
jgi:hypothetical protein